MIVNLTQHRATPEQSAEGVRDVEPEWLDELRHLLTFEEPPSDGELKATAKDIVSIARQQESHAHAAMIGGAPFLMAALEEALDDAGIEPMYAFSRRSSVEVVTDDGSVEKRSVFQHAGWVRPRIGRA